MPKLISRPYSKCKKCHGNGKRRIYNGGDVSPLIAMCDDCDRYRKQDNEKSVRKAAHRSAYAAQDAAKAQQDNASANLRLAQAMEEANRLKALELELLAKR